MSSDPLRVGVVRVFTAEGWTGGLNYFRSLLEALEEYCPEIEVHLVTARNADRSAIASAGFRTVSPTPLLDSGLARSVGRVLRFAGIGDVFLERLLRREEISVVSHSAFPLRLHGIPVVGWIPDLQHRTLPDMFGPARCRVLDRYVAELCRWSRLVIVSSEAARKDLLEFVPAAAHKVRVLRFAPRRVEQAGLLPPIELKEKYGLAQRFFYLPNQFWTHKNHETAVLALSNVCKRHPEAVIVATGSTKDERNPGRMDALRNAIAAAGMERNFLILGSVPYEDVVALMRDAIAVINPSLFEGWSTTVEEAKTLGARMILSDIPVHREQADGAALFFGPREAESLAAQLEALWKTPASREVAGERYVEAHRIRQREMAERYRAILHEAITPADASTEIAHITRSARWIL